MKYRNRSQWARRRNALARWEWTEGSPLYRAGILFMWAGAFVALVFGVTLGYVLVP